MRGGWGGAERAGREGKGILVRGVRGAEEEGREGKEGVEEEGEGVGWQAGAVQLGWRCCCARGGSDKDVCGVADGAAATRSGQEECTLQC